MEPCDSCISKLEVQLLHTIASKLLAAVTIQALVRSKSTLHKAGVRSLATMNVVREAKGHVEALVAVEGTGSSVVAIAAVNSIVGAGGRQVSVMTTARITERSALYRTLCSTCVRRRMCANR